MKNSTTRNTLVLSALAIVLSASVSAAPKVGKYRLVDLNSSSISSKANGLNNNNNVVGTFVDQNGVTQGFVTHGTRTTLPLPVGVSKPEPRSINTSGQIAGWGAVTVSGSGFTRGLYWSDWYTTPVQVVPFNAVATANAFLMSISDSGLMMGAAAGWNFNGTPTSAMQGMNYHGPSNTKTYMGTLTSTSFSTATMTASNGNNVSVGYGVGADGKTHAIRYNGSGAMSAMGDPVGAQSCYAYDINVSNKIVGDYWVSAGQSKAFMKNDYAASVDIPRLMGASGDDSNSAASINADGFVVGSCEIGNAKPNGYLWDGTTAYNLNSITSNIAGYSIQYATGINDRQVISANALASNGQTHAVMLQPLQTFQGKLTFENWEASPSFVDVHWEVRNTVGSVVDSGNTKTNILGLYTIETTYFTTGSLYIKPSHWLAKRVQFTNTIWEAQSLSFTFKNGDCDGDNGVSILDYSLLSDAFDTVVGQSGYDANADLDGDGGVSILDYSILSDNFDLQGDF